MTTVTNDFDREFKELNKAYSESCNNVKFLTTMDK
jgi:hypothetical protein